MTPHDAAIGPALDDEAAMRLALGAARAAAAAGEVPVGAAILARGKILAVAGNAMRSERDPTAHAEIRAIRTAAKALRAERLTGAVLYSTVEPCAMCAGAAVLARVARIVFAAADPKAGACGSVLSVTPNERLNHRPVVEGGLLAESAAALLRGFFEKRRARAAD